MGDERWQVTGSAAEVYQRQLVPAIFALWPPVVLDLAAPASGERLLDTACGTGVVARLAADRVGPTGQVVGQDLNPGMLAVASALLAPGGRLAAMVWRSIDHSRGFATLADLLDRHIGPAAGATMRAPFALNDEEALRDLLAGGGFEEVAVHPQAGTVRFNSIQEFVLAQGTGSPLAAPIAAADPAARADLVAAAETTLATWQGSDEFAFPIGPSCSAGVFPEPRAPSFCESFSFVPADLRPVRVSSRGIAVRPRFMMSTTPRMEAARRKGAAMTTNTPNPIPDSYRRVTPCLVVRGAAKALEFYAEVFQATERMRFPGPDGRIAHAEIQIGDSVVIVDDEFPERGTKAPPPGGLAGSPYSLFIYVENVDEVVARAVELGATLVRPPQDQFYGDRDGHIIDPFGHGWTIATHVEDVEPQEMMRRMAELQNPA